MITAAERGSVGLVALEENRANQRGVCKATLYFSSNTVPLIAHML